MRMKTYLASLALTGTCAVVGWGQAPGNQPVVIKVSTALVTRSLSAPVPASAVSQKPAKPTGVPKAATLMETAALQTTLDRNGFGVGFIDGKEGSRTTWAIKDYARSRKISLYAARRELAADEEPATLSYTVTAADLAEVGSAPTDWEKAAEVPSMACGSLDEVLSERFHASRAFLSHLNPAITDWASVTAGTALTVPNSRPTDWSATAARLEVDCSAFRVRAFDTNGTVIASFPCSIARLLHKVPVGDLTFTTFAPNPNYTFDPENFPESAKAQEIGRKLIIPPGPRNPVGVYWLSLNAPGFGMHGTPHPETIGRRESHGCFRLTNWDITTLAGMVEAGTPVRVMGIRGE